MIIIPEQHAHEQMDPSNLKDDFYFAKGHKIQSKLS